MQVPTGRFGVGAGRDHGAPHASFSSGVEVLDRAGEGADSFLLEAALECGILVICQSVDGLGIDGVVRVSLRKADPSAGKERVSSDTPRLAVEVAVVVSSGAEGAQRAESFACPFEPEREKVVDRFPPRRRMDLGASGEHAVEVEEAGSHLGRKSERAGSGARSGEAMVELDPLFVCHRHE